MQKAKLKKEKKRPSMRQAKLIKLILENMGNKGSKKSMGELMLEAGYSKAQSKNPKPILATEAVKEKVDDFINMLDDKRRMAISYVTQKKLKHTHPRDLAYITDIFTKNHQLLTGGKTENTGVEELANKLDNWIKGMK